MFSTPICFTISDLDRNGRLEVIAASNQRAISYGILKVFEIAPDGLDIVECEDTHREAFFESDIIYDKEIAYYDEDDNTYSYILADYERYGYSLNSSIFSEYKLCNGIIYDKSFLSSTTTRETDEITGMVIVKETFYDENKKEITEEGFEDVLKNPFPERRRYEISFNWLSEEELTEENLLSSYEKFISGFENEIIN